MSKDNEYKGFCLFNDIEDEQLRTRNRAVVMANIAEDNTKRHLMSPKGASLILGYLQQVPDALKMETTMKFKEQLRSRGFSIV